MDTTKRSFLRPGFQDRNIYDNYCVFPSLDGLWFILEICCLYRVNVDGHSDIPFFLGTLGFKEWKLKERALQMGFIKCFISGLHTNVTEKGIWLSFYSSAWG